MRYLLGSFLIVIFLSGCQSNVTNIPVSPDSELGKQMLAMDAEGRAYQNKPLFTRELQEFERARGGKCGALVFDSLREPGLILDRESRLYAAEGISAACGRRAYYARIDFRDPHHTVAKAMKVFLGPEDEASFRKKAEEFVKFATEGKVEEMLAITSHLSYGEDKSSVRKVYADDIIKVFKEAKVEWDSVPTPNIDEYKNVGLIFTGTVTGQKTFNFGVSVATERGRIVVISIKKLGAK